MANVEEGIDPCILSKSLENPHPDPTLTRTNGLGLNSVLCFNIFHADMDSTEGHSSPARRWKELKPHIRSLNNLLARCIQRRDIGSIRQDNNHSNFLYLVGAVPRVFISAEDLLSKKKDAISGLRIWFHQVDETFDFCMALNKVLNENNNMKIKASPDGLDTTSIAPYGGNSKNQNGPSLGGGGRSSGRYNPRATYLKSINIDPSLRITDLETLAALVLEPYTKDERYQVFSELHEAENALDKSKPDSIFNIYSILHPEKGIELTYCNHYASRICDEQINVLTYFDAANNGGIRGSTWKGFPFPENCYLLNNRNFECVTFYHAPLPHVLQKDYLVKMKNIKGNGDTIRREIEQKKGEKESLLDKLNSATDEYTKSQLKATLDELEEELRKDEFSFMENEEALKRLSFSLSNTDDYISNSFGKNSDEEVIAQKNVTLQHRINNSKKKAKIRGTYKPGTSAYVDEMTRFKRFAITEFWESFMTDPRVTRAIDGGRKFFKSLPEDGHFVECLLSIETLSPYANMFVKKYVELSNIHENYHNHNYVIINIAVAFTAAKYGYYLKPNTMFQGPGGSGKSKIIEDTLAHLFSGSYLIMDHFTGMAFNTSDDPSDVFLVQEEATDYFLGTDKKGKETGGNAQIKSRMSSQKTSTLHFAIDDDGKRRSYYTTNRAMNTLSSCNNACSLDPDEPMGQRLMIFAVPKQMNNNTRNKASLNPTAFRRIRNDAKFTKVNHLLHFYVLVWFKAIESESFDEISTDVAKIISGHVFTEMKARGFYYPDDRRIKNYLDICATITMWYGVYMHFFSELGIKNRMTEDGKVRSFDPLMLLGLEKWGITSIEIAIHVLTMMEPIWIPYTKLEIFNLVCNHCVTWPPRLSGFNRTKFKRDRIADDEENVVIANNRAGASSTKKDANPVAQPQTQQQQQQQLNKHVLNPIQAQLSSSNFISSINLASSKGKNAPVNNKGKNNETFGVALKDDFPTDEDIMSMETINANESRELEAFDEFEDRYVFYKSNEKEKFYQEDNLDYVPCHRAPVYKTCTKMHQVDNTLYVQMTEVNQAQIIGKLRGYMDKAISEEDIHHTMRRMEKEFVDSLDYKFIVLPDELVPNLEEERTKKKKGPRRHTSVYDEVEIDDSKIRWGWVQEYSDVHKKYVDKTVRIPLVIMDVDTIDNNKKRVSFAVHWFRNSYSKEAYSSILKDCIKTLEHAHQPTASYITGYPTKRTSNDEYGKVKSYHQVPELVHLSNKPDKIMHIENPYSISSVERAILYNTSYEMSQLKETLESEFFNYAVNEVDQDIETQFMLSYWDYLGLPETEDVSVVLPSNTLNAVKKIRSELTYYHPLNETLIVNYPDEIIEGIEKKERDLSRRTAGSADFGKLSTMSNRPDANSRRPIIRYEAPTLLNGQKKTELAKFNSNKSTPSSSSSSSSSSSYTPTPQPSSPSSVMSPPSNPALNISSSGYSGVKSKDFNSNKNKIGKYELFTIPTTKSTKTQSKLADAPIKVVDKSKDINSSSDFDFEIESDCTGDTDSNLMFEPPKTNKPDFPRSNSDENMDSHEGGAGQKRDFSLSKTPHFSGLGGNDNNDDDVYSYRSKRSKVSSRMDQMAF